MWEVKQYEINATAIILRQVTANNLASRIDMGNNTKIPMATKGAPKAAAQAAFISIKANTPNLTALPIRGPMGF